MITDLQSDIMSRLRAETHAEHKLAEGSEFEQALVSGRVSRPTFIAYLQQRQLIHAALDPAVTALAVGQSRFDGLIPPELLQTANLAADLEFFGASNGATALPPTADFVKEIELLGENRCASLLGIYYVFEGSKNGARYIARAVQRSLALTPPDGLRYLDPHGPAQRDLWTAFKERMNAIEFTNVEQDLMVNAAKRAFVAVRAVDSAIWNRVSAESEGGK